MTRRERAFLVEWLIVNAIGFLIANFLGSSLYGLVVGNKGHLILGATFGLAQAIVLARHYPHPNRLVFLWWIAVSSIGFMLGANLASELTWQFVSAENQVVGSAIFGFFLCIPFSIGQWFVLRWIIYKSPATHWWLPTSLLAWFVTEGVSAVFGHPLWFMVIFGITIALLTGLVWVWRIGPKLGTRS